MNDNLPPLITGNQSLEIETKPSLGNMNVINRLWTMVMDKVTDVLKDTAPHMIDYVIDESIGSDKYDECPLGHRLAKEAISQTEQGMMDSKCAITAEDFVMVENCPGHWSWASPFTVEAINGEWAKLEMVGELVETNRLSRL